MYKLFELSVLILLLICDAECQSSSEGTKKSNRQKRLLFYDEEGNLVKTYTNPYLRDFTGKIPSLGNIYNPFLGFLHPSSYSGPTAYMIPVSNEVIQQINSDPVYQNKLLNIPRKDLVIEPNPLCAGKRTQIPTDKCERFLNCWDGWAFEQECPEGLMFSREGYCDYPQNVDCSKRSKEPTPITTVATSTQCSTEFETFRNEMQCSEFFVCVDRSPIKFKCPADLAYSQTLGVCDYKYRVDCNTPTAIPMDDKADQPIAPCSSASDDQQKDPINSSTQAPGDASSSPALRQSAQVPASDLKTILTSNSMFDSQSWTSTHVAVSRQDAIRQLKLGSIANIAV